jgi:hypothetical protein
MRYKAEWKGRLRVLNGGHITWDGRGIGSVCSVTRPGARSPGGMVTNTVFVTGEGGEFPSMTEALDHLVAQAGKGVNPRSN